MEKIYLRTLLDDDLVILVKWLNDETISLKSLEGLISLIKYVKLGKTIRIPLKITNYEISLK